jgi:hypothetical protein
MTREEYYKRTSGHNVALHLPPNLRAIDGNIKKKENSKGCFYIEQPDNYVTFYSLVPRFKFIDSCVPDYTFCRGVVDELYTCRKKSEFRLLGYITFEEFCDMYCWEKYDLVCGGGHNVFSLVNCGIPSLLKKIKGVLGG